jgi:hypothetical protein
LGWRGGRFSFVGIDDAGNARFPEVPAVSKCAIPPAWDDTHFVLATVHNYSNLECWDVSAVTSFVDAVIEANRSNPDTPYYAGTNMPSDVRVWGPQSKHMNAIALADNAVIVAYTRGLPTYGHWYVTALNRSNGTALWEFELPAEPRFGGLCIDRDGSVIVVLRDGRVVAYGDSSLRIATPTTLPMAAVDTAYAHTLEAVGGSAPYTWSLQSGTLPTGLDMDTNGVISGLPLIVQTNTFSARVQDATQAETAQTFTLLVVPEPSIVALIAALLLHSLPR